MKLDSIIKTTLVFITLLAFATSTTAQSRERQSLKGKWKFILGDNMKFANPKHDDSEWEKIYVPSSWEDEGFKRYDGFAWYRKTFEIEFEKVNGPLYLKMGRIDDADEVYFNGELIGKTGEFGPDMVTAYNVYRNYIVPEKVINKKGKNVIAVRVYDGQMHGGITEGYIGLYNYEEYKNSIQLAGSWKFNLSDDMDWAKEKFDDSDWESVMVPAEWGSIGYARYDGFAWYRTKFTAPKEMNDDAYMLILGRIDDMDEVYINGEKIGGTGDIESKYCNDGEWDKMRNYHIPDGVIKPGRENTIAVRVYDMTQRGGIYSGPVTIIRSVDYKDFWRTFYKEQSDFYHWFWSYFEE